MNERNESLTYEQSIVQIKDFHGGKLGLLVIVISVVATAGGGWLGASLFPPGSYPRIVLALPGLLAGGVAFFASSSLLWKYKEESTKLRPGRDNSVEVACTPDESDDKGATEERLSARELAARSPSRFV